jgi:hypothetical protein
VLVFRIEGLCDALAAVKSERDAGREARRQRERVSNTIFNYCVLPALGRKRSCIWVEVLVRI